MRQLLHCTRTKTKQKYPSTCLPPQVGIALEPIWPPLSKWREPKRTNTGHVNAARYVNIKVGKRHCIDFPSWNPKKVRGNKMAKGREMVK